jgi:ATP phosphoribosyltransferase regulatory subunit
MAITEIPKGFKTLLPDEANKREKILTSMERVIKLWGYNPLFPPTVEFLSTFKAVDEKFEEIAFKVVDRETGKLMAVRPDFTPQVARIVASSFKDEAPPFRFYYKGKVFRDVEGERETYQIGFELIGVDEPEADAEIVSVVVNILENLGLKSFQIDIGNSEFIDGVIEELQIPSPTIFIKLLSSKDISGIELFMEEHHISGERREKILTLLDLYGREETLDKAAQIFQNEQSLSAVKRLKEILEILKSYGFESKVIFDLSERKGMKYHTGITYEVFHPLLGCSLASGGRYDQLLKKFGRDLPATGIAVNVDSLQLLLERKGIFKEEKKDFYIIDLKKERKLAYEIAKALREKGFSVARDIIKRSIEESVKTAFGKGYRYVIVLNRELKTPHHIYLSPEKHFPLDDKNLIESILTAVKEEK